MGFGLGLGFGCLTLGEAAEGALLSARCRAPLVPDHFLKEGGVGGERERHVVGRAARRPKPEARRVARRRD